MPALRLGARTTGARRLLSPAARRRASVSSTGLNSRYEIRVKGILDARWTAWFEGLQVSSDGEETVIAGPVADQAALHGLLTKVRDLGLFLISVRHLGPD